MGSMTVLVPTDLMAQIEETAEIESRDPQDLVADAIRKYLSDRKWQIFLNRAERQAKEKGLTEEDVPRLIQEVRRENEARGI